MPDADTVSRHPQHSTLSTAPSAQSAGCAWHLLPGGAAASMPARCQTTYIDMYCNSSPGLKETTKLVWPFWACGVPGLPGRPTASESEAGDVALPTPLTLLQRRDGHFRAFPMCRSLRRSQPAGRVSPVTPLPRFRWRSEALQGLGCDPKCRVPAQLAPDLAGQLAGGRRAPRVCLFGERRSNQVAGIECHWQGLPHAAVLALENEHVAHGSIGAGRREGELDAVAIQSQSWLGHRSGGTWQGDNGCSKDVGWPVQSSTQSRHGAGWVRRPEGQHKVIPEAA